MNTNPSTFFATGQSIIVANATTSANNGHFSVVDINRSAANNIVVHNVDGVASGASGGSLSHVQLIYELQTTMSTVYTTTASRVRFFGMENESNNGEFDVVTIDFSSGTNIVVNNSLGGDQLAETGRIVHESKSIFTLKPSLTFSDAVNSIDQHLQFDVAATFNSFATVANNTLIAIDILTIPAGDPADMVLQIL